MIAQVLNREFVLDQLQSVRAVLAQGLPEIRRGSTDPYANTAEDLAAAAAALQQAELREKAVSSGQSGFETPLADRRTADLVPLDDVAFFSRSPIISLFQTALEEYFNAQSIQSAGAASLEFEGRRGSGDDILVTDRSLAACPEISEMTCAADECSANSVKPIHAGSVAGWRKESAASPGNTLSTKLLRRTCTMADNARLVLVGDWGSGVPRARKVATEIRRVLDDGKQSGFQQHVIHLGDVYYSGWESEYRDRFLAYWPVRVDEAATISSWSLNGNHDMYSGGHAYFDFLLADPRFARQQRSSYFSLVNKCWQILGLDTAYEENALHGPQASWVKDLVGKNSRKSMLLSHHQLFSAYENGSEQMEAALHDVLTGSVPIDAWFWGHEHRCVCYSSFKNVRNARLVGHGGVPVYMVHKQGDPYPPPAQYEFRDYISKMLGLEHFALFGFAVLDFKDSTIHARYIDENGRMHHEEVIQ